MFMPADLSMTVPSCPGLHQDPSAHDTQSLRGVVTVQWSAKDNIVT